MVRRLTRLQSLCALAVMLVVVSSIVGCGGGKSDLAQSASAEDAVSVSQAALRGDLNGNGLPDITDAVGILRIIVGLDPANALADCDCDGATGITDAIALLRCLVGLDEWPIACGEMIGPDGQTLVWVPGGSLMMGSDDGLWDNEQPVHQVTLDGFWIGQCEVTEAQFLAFCITTGYGFPGCVGFDPQGDDHPVVCVTWYDAQEYCDYYGYSLPTEAQWEYAAAGPTSRTWPWGDTWDPQKCCNGGNRGPGGYTFPVGSFPAGASWCGALDMAGNVWEWCADWYSDTYYQISPELNPPGPESGSHRVLRGGSCNSLSPDNLRAAYRNGYGVPSNRFVYYGFRCSRGR